MPRGVSRSDEARLQGRFIEHESGLLVPVQRNQFGSARTFQAGTFDLPLGTATAGQLYRVRYALSTRSGTRARTVTGATPDARHALGTGNHEYSMLFKATNSSAAEIEADGATYSGTISDWLMYPVRASLGRLRVFDAVTATSVGEALMLHLPMTGGNSYQIQVTVLKAAGSELRFSNGSSDGSNVIQTTSGLTSGVFTTSSFVAATEFVTIAASGGAFTGRISDVYLLGV